MSLRSPTQEEIVKQCTIVREDEIDPTSGRISLKSPLVQALIGKRVGETASVSTPRGTVEWAVQEIGWG